MNWRKFTQQDLEEAKAEFHEDGPLIQALAMATEVILLTLGPDFFRQHCVGSKGSKRSYLRPQSVLEDDLYDYQNRVIALGDMLFLLKDCEGFDAFLKPLRTNDLQSVYFELQVAKSLFRSGNAIRFVECIGKKGFDYDLSANIDGVDVAIEAKTRRQGEVSAIPKIIDNLNDARGQLPKNGPGVIAISIPSKWLLAHHGIISSEIQNFLRNTSRVNHVVVFSQAWVKQEIGRISVSMMEQFDGVKPRHPFRKNPIIRAEKEATIDGAAGARKPSFW